MGYEWDEGKAASNEDKHKVSFEEAKTCFLDPCRVIFRDLAHSDEEDRDILIGFSKKDRLLMVSYTIRDNVTRIISARKATSSEAKYYESRIRLEHP